MLPVASLAAFACDPAQSRGRRHPEQEAPTRPEFTRDPDRIVPPAAFRRLALQTPEAPTPARTLLRTGWTHARGVRAEAAARHLRDEGYSVSVRQRDINKDREWM